MAVLTHHAYYIEGSASRFEAYKTALKPFWAGKFERFGVDDARALIELAALKNFKEALFFIGAASITGEAQQALLKLLEEPQEDTTFVLLAPHGALLPTVRSRMLPYPELSTVSKDSPWQIEAGKFLKMGGKERSDFIAKMLKDDEDGLKERVRDFVDALEAQCANSGLLQNERGREALQDIAMVRDYIGDRAPSLKMLLEHLALSLPKI